MARQQLLHFPWRYLHARTIDHFLQPTADPQNSSRWVAERMDVSPDDRWLNFLPLFYVAGGVIANFAALQSSAASIRAGSVPESHREGAVLVVHYTRDHSENAARTCRPHVDGSPQPTDDHYWRHALST
jgi:hypothetical protein